jgi:hypothetical protein
MGVLRSEKETSSARALLEKEIQSVTLATAKHFIFLATAERPTRRRVINASKRARKEY